VSVDTAAPTRTYQLFINGEWTPASTGKTFEVRNPATGEKIADVAEATVDDVERAVDAARKAFDDGRWSGLSPGERSAILYRLADKLEENAALLAELESRNAGKPIKLSSNSDIPFAIDNLRFFAGAARQLEGRATAEYVTGYTSMIRREPLGVVASITPWNYPFMMAIWKVGPALAAGNTVVLKPASLTPLTTLELARIAREAGLPDGVLNVLTGPGERIGNALAAHAKVDMVSLTGDSSTGRKIMEAASGTVKRAHLELGGKAALIVYEDADIEAAAQGAVVAGFVNTGQDCTAGTRVYAHESVYKPLLERIVEKAKQVRVGDPMNEKTDMGPLVSAAQRDKVEGFVKRAVAAGAKVAVGGKRADIASGFYFEPTVITDAAHESEMIQSEAFGPVIAMSTFQTGEEAIHRANDVAFGLSGSVWTKDVFKALNTAKQLNFGTVWINDHLPIASEMPHGGFKQSGFGKDMSSYSLEEYTRVKHVMAELTGAPKKGWHFTIFGDAE